MKLYNDSFILCNKSLYCLLSSCTNHIFGENVVPTGQNARAQSDCRFFKSAISPEQNDEKAWFFGVSIQIHRN